MKSFAFFLAVLCAAPVMAQTQAVTEKVWVDVNLGIAASAGEEQVYTFAGTLFREPVAMATAYAKPSRGADFDFGGGYMFTPKIGVGVSFQGTAHKDPVGLGVTVPHPYFFNASTTAANVTDSALTRTEGTVNIQAMVSALNTDRLRVRVFGGPSFFRLKADMVQDIEFDQAATIFSRANFVSITGYDKVEAEGTGIGFHAGADMSVFFTRVVGVGAFGRYSRGTVSLDPEPMSEVAQDVRVGGFQTGGGLRLRF
jgi:hypothetical protein